MADAGRMRLSLEPTIYSLITQIAEQEVNLITAAMNTGCFFQADETATITEIGMMFKASSNLPPPTYRSSLQSVDSSGVATGTVLGAGNWTAPPGGDPNPWRDVWVWIPITSTAVSRGQRLAIVIKSNGSLATKTQNHFDAVRLLAVPRVESEEPEKEAP